MNRRPLVGVWKLLLLIHLIPYEAYFITPLRNIQSAPYNMQSNFTILLVWTVLLFAHVGVTFYYSGRGDITRLERDAYREGYTDAVRQFSDRPYEARRLALDDEGELIEVPEEKPKRRER
jgi:hypothetical protein